VTGNEARDARCERHARLGQEHRRNRLEKRYRRLLILYPKDHRDEHAEEMVGVLLAAAAHHAPGGSALDAARRTGRHAADSADLVAGALRIRGRMTLGRIRRGRWLSCAVRDPRWSDALAVVSVVAPLLLLVAALAEFSIPQATASGVTGHPYWPIGNTLAVSDLPLAIGAPVVAVLACLRLRWIAGLAALATGISQVVSGAIPAFSRDTTPATAFTVLLAGTAAAALLLSPGLGRGLALLKWWGAALVGAGALVLGGFSVGSNGWFGYSPVSSSGLTALRSEVTGVPGDLLIAGVLVVVAAACLRTAVSRRVLALLAIPVIPYAILWQEKLAGDLVGPFGGGPTLIPSSPGVLYLPPLVLACLIVAGTRIARRRAAGRRATGRKPRVGTRPSAAGPRGPVSA